MVTEWELNHKQKREFSYIMFTIQSVYRVPGENDSA